MKHLLAAIALSTTFAALAQDATIIAANATLKDNSTLKGELTTKQITGSTLFLEKLELDPALIKSITFKGTNGESKVELANGDKFAMTVANENFAIKSMLGELAIPRENFRSIALAARRASTGGGEDGLIFHCTFDDAAALSSPAVGPAVKLELGKIREQGGRQGGALFVNPGIAGAEILFPAGAIGPEGCFEFWANMASGKTEFSTGGDPRFLMFYDTELNERGAFDFACNDGQGNSGICGTFFGIHTYSKSGYTHMMPYSDIFKGDDYNGWHHYALVWTPSRLTIFIDGKEICHADGHLQTELLAQSAVTVSIPLNRIRGRSFNNKSAFYMDDLKIWNFAKTEFDLN